MTDCPHTSTGLRVRRGLAGKLVQRQCLLCRDGIGDAIAYSAFPLDQALKLKPWIATKQPNSKRREYQSYLQSAEWKAKRALVLDRDGYLCQPCARHGLEVEATEAAHLTYDRFGEELLSDLEANCSTCNQAERLGRIGGGHA